MKPIGEFLTERLLRALPAPASEVSADPKSTALVAMRDIVPPKEAERLAATLEQYATTSDFAEAVTQAVPPPKAGESEDQFVQRAKEAICKVLLAKFGG